MDISFFKLDTADTTGSVSVEATGRTSKVKESAGGEESFAEVMNAERTRLETDKADRGDAVKDGAGGESGPARKEAAGENDAGLDGRDGEQGDGAGLWAELTGGLLTSTGAAASFAESEADCAGPTLVPPSTEGDVNGTGLTSQKTVPAATGPMDGSTTGGFTLTGAETAAGESSDWAAVRAGGDSAGTAHVEGAWTTGDTAPVHATAAAFSAVAEGGDTAEPSERRYPGPTGQAADEAMGGKERTVSAAGASPERSGDAGPLGSNKIETGPAITQGRAAGVAEDDGAAAADALKANPSAAEVKEGYPGGVVNGMASERVSAQAPGAEPPAAGALADEASTSETREARAREGGTTAVVEEAAEGEAGYATVRQGPDRSVANETEDGGGREVRGDAAGVDGAEAPEDGHDLYASDEGAGGEAAAGGNGEDGGPALFEDDAEEHPAPATLSGKEKPAGPARTAEAPATTTVQSAQGDASVRPGGEGQPSAAAQTARPEPAEVYEKFSEGVRISLGQGGREVRIKLNPEALGRLHIKLNLNDAAVSARILVENPAVKALLEGDSARVREMFASQGLSLDDYTVELSAESNDGFSDRGDRYAAREQDVNGGGGKGFGHAMGEFDGSDGHAEGFGPGGPVRPMPWFESAARPIGHHGGTSSKGIDIFA